MKVIPENEIPRQLLHALDGAVEQLFAQFPPPFDAHRFAQESPDFQFLMAKGLAALEVGNIPDYAPEFRFQLPDHLQSEEATGEIPPGDSIQRVSEEALEALIHRGIETGFYDESAQNPEQAAISYKGRPRSGIEHLDEDYLYALTYWLRKMDLDSGIRNAAHLIFNKAAFTGFFWYPPKGYMEWHTNENRPGYRFYCVYAREEAKSFFRFRCPDTGKVITSWDKKGWNFRIFKIGVDDARVWHCVHSNTDRLSFGFTVHE